MVFFKIHLLVNHFQVISELVAVFGEKQKAVALGQSAVMYDENGYVLGGGIIKSVV